MRPDSTIGILPGGVSSRDDTEKAPAASQWLDSRPLGADRDAAIDAFTGPLGRSDPASAPAWAAAISEPGKRADRVREILSA